MRKSFSERRSWRRSVLAWSASSAARFSPASSAENPAVELWVAQTPAPMPTTMSDATAPNPRVILVAMVAMGSSFLAGGVVGGLGGHAGGDVDDGDQGAGTGADADDVLGRLRRDGRGRRLDVSARDLHHLQHLIDDEADHAVAYAADEDLLLAARLAGDAEPPAQVDDRDDRAAQVVDPN